MKRFLIISICVILLSGCTTGNNSEKNSDLPDYQYMYSEGRVPVQKTEGGYYVMQNDFIYYVDGKSMKAVPLCNKSNCTHTVDENCNAYFMSTDNTHKLQVYKDYIYIHNKELETDKDGVERLVSTLYEMPLDGSSKEKIYTFPSLINNFYIINDYIYYDVLGEDEEGSLESNLNNSIYKVELGSYDEPVMVVDYSDYKGHYRYGCSVKNIFKNKLYVYEFYYTVKDFMNNKGKNVYQSSFAVIDLETGKRIACKPLDIGEEQYYYAGICNDSLFFSMISEKENTETFYLSDLDFKNSKKLFSYKMSNKHTVKYNVICDDSYFYVDNTVDEGQKKKWIEVYNTNGKRISKVFYPDTDISVHIYTQGDDRYFWFTDESSTYVIEKPKLLENGSTLQFEKII